MSLRLVDVPRINTTYLENVQIPLALVDRDSLETAFVDRPDRLRHYMLRSMTISMAELAREQHYASLVRDARAQMAA